MKRALSMLVCVGMGLVAGCSTPPRIGYDPEIKVPAEAAGAAFQHGEVARAEALYGKALARARLTDNREEIVRNAYNLAICRMISGQLGEARALLVQARLLAAARGVMPARIMLAESEVARLAGDGPNSEQLARQALAAGADKEGQVQSWLLQGESWVLTGQFQSALDCYQSALKRVSRDTAATIRARMDQLALGLVQAGMMPGSVATLQLSRSDWLKQAGQFKEMAAALQGAALALEREAKWTEAFDCRIRAALSLQASGDRKTALSEAVKAYELAGQTGNVNSKTLAATLMDGLK